MSATYDVAVSLIHRRAPPKCTEALGGRHPLMFLTGNVQFPSPIRASTARFHRQSHPANARNAVPRTGVRPAVSTAQRKDKAREERDTGRHRQRVAVLLQPDRLAGLVSSGQGTIRVGSLAVRKFVLGAGRWDTIGTPTLVSNPPEVQVTLQALDKGGEKERQGPTR